MAQDHAGDFRQLLPCPRAQGGLAGIEEYIRHVHDEAASCVASFKNQVELAKEFKNLAPDGDAMEKSLKSEMNHHAEGILKGLGYVGIT